MILFKWLQIVMIGVMIVIVESASSGLLDNAETDQAVLRPRAKRAQEVLMFGNQQNRRTTENIANANKVFAAAPTAEKRTLGSSGLEDVKAALTESSDTFNNHPKQQQQQPSFSIFDRERISSPYEKNYDNYGKVIMNELREELPRNWDISPYAKYFGMEEDRRKRSEGINKNTDSSLPTSGSPLAPTIASSSTSSPSPLAMVPAQLPATPRPFAQAKRSMQALYPEPRYKRALDRDDLLALLSLWENGPRVRNWRNYANNEEYENMEDESNYLGQDLDEDPRASVGAGWLDGSMYALPHHLNLGTEIAPSEFGIPRTHPLNSYEQYGAQYNTPVYAAENSQYASLLYPHASYYPPEKRFMVSRKRSQAYDTYSGRNINDIVGFSQLMNSQPQGYPNNLPQRLFY